MIIAEMGCGKTIKNKFKIKAFMGALGCSLGIAPICDKERVN